MFKHTSNTVFLAKFLDLLRDLQIVMIHPQQSKCTGHNTREKAYKLKECNSFPEISYSIALEVCFDFLLFAVGSSHC